MPVVESYPSIVGIAQVAQAAGQGRYNQWLAEYNARSNQMSTNALMSGFQTGSSLGMSMSNMWQQQQQFAQRQGFIESQAAQKLEKDTKYTEAMMPALKPYMERLYPHMNEQEIGTMIGRMPRSQVDAIANTIQNAGMATAWHDLKRSPHALQQQAENVYRNMMEGKHQQSQRIENRLKPIQARLANADFAFDEKAVQAEIAQILREEGATGEGRNAQQELDQKMSYVRGPDGQPAYATWRGADGKVHTVDVRPRGGTGTGAKTRTPMEELKDYNTLQGYVDNRHKSMLDTWEQSYTKGYDFSESDVATHVESNGSLWRRRRPDELNARNIMQRGGINYVPATIPPRPTRKQAEDWVSSRYPGFSNLIGRGGPPGVGPAPQPGVPQLGAPQVPTGPPQGAAMQQPGQVMPQVPRPQGLPTTPAPLPPQRYEPIRDPAMIQVEEEARSAAIKKIRGEGQMPKPGEAPKSTELGVATHRGLTELIGSEGRQQTSLGVEFELHVRQDRRPEDFAPRIMTGEEAESHTKTIKGFEGKLADATAYPNKPGGEWKGKLQELVGGRKFEHPTESNLSELHAMFKKDPSLASSKMWRAGFTKAEVRSFQDTRSQYDRKRVFATTVAAAAVKATPPGQRPDIANIPIMNQRNFEQLVVTDAVQAGDVFLTPRDGLFIVTGNAIAAARQSYLLREHSRNQPISGFPTQSAR